MEKEGKAWVIVLIVVAAVLVVIGLLILISFLTGHSSSPTPSTDIYATHCKITSSTNNIQLAVGTSSSLPISGYQGTLSQVSWISANPAIAAVNPVSGPDAMVQGESAGTTTITGTDNTVGPKCTVSIQITVQ